MMVCLRLNKKRQLFVFISEDNRPTIYVLLVFSLSDPCSHDLDFLISFHKSTSQCTFPNSNYLIANFFSYNHLSPSSISLINSIDSIFMRKTIKKTLNHPDWCNAMFEKRNNLDENHTWNLVNLPKDKKVIGCKWVFSIKVNTDASVTRLKGRLVAKNYTQIYGVDYSDTFSLVTKLTPIRLFVFIVISRN